MITKFPFFTPLKATHGEFVMNAAAKRQPYSDHNFASLLSWNIDDSTHIAHHNDNIVLLLKDYIDSNKRILTSLGSENLHETIEEILSLEQDNLPYTMELVPEDVANKINKEKFNVWEDPNSHDYIYSVQQILSYSGNKYGAKRNFVNRFKKYYPVTYCTQIDLSNETMQHQILALYKKWAEYKSYADIENANEFKALRKFLQNISHFQNVVCIGLYNDENLIGFAIVEIITEKYCIIHFEKADYKHYIGIYPYLMQKVAELASSFGCIHINYEQDLGLDFLKKSKKSYNPVFFLKKYAVSLKKN